MNVTCRLFLSDVHLIRGWLAAHRGHIRKWLGTGCRKHCNADRPGHSASRLTSPYADSLDMCRRTRSENAMARHQVERVDASDGTAYRWSAERIPSQFARLYVPSRTGRVLCFMNEVAVTTAFPWRDRQGRIRLEQRVSTFSTVEGAGAQGGCEQPHDKRDSGTLLAASRWTGWQVEVMRRTGSLGVNTTMDRANRSDWLGSNSRDKTVGLGRWSSRSRWHQIGYRRSPEVPEAPEVGRVVRCGRQAEVVGLMR